MLASFSIVAGEEGVRRRHCVDVHMHHFNRFRSFHIDEMKVVFVVVGLSLVMVCHKFADFVRQFLLLFPHDGCPVVSYCVENCGCLRECRSCVHFGVVSFDGVKGGVNLRAVRRRRRVFPFGRRNCRRLVGAVACGGAVVRAGVLAASHFRRWCQGVDVLLMPRHVHVGVCLGQFVGAEGIEVCAL